MFHYGGTMRGSAIDSDRTVGYLLSFVQNLAAAAARGDDMVFIFGTVGAADWPTDHGNGVDVGKPSSRIGRRQCDGFGAKRQSQARIFEIGANDYFPIVQPNCRAD